MLSFALGCNVESNFAGGLDIAADSDADENHTSD